MSQPGFSDSDWAGDVGDRQSTSGYVFQIGGTSISWRSKKQSCVALSTAEAEYIEAAQEATWIRQIATDLQNEPQDPTVINMRCGGLNLSIKFLVLYKN